jgi:hypothetical protein
MSGLVPSYLLKLRRAEKHLAEVEVMVDEYVHRNPYDVSEGVEDDQGRTLRTLRFTEQPSDMLAVVIGDFIHNMRSALNHLAASCAPRENWRMVQFPIFETDPFELDPATGKPLADRQRSRDAWERQIRGMSDEAVAALKGLQPYYLGPDDSTFHGLTLVEELSNTDKHRELVVLSNALLDPVVTTILTDGTRLAPIRRPGHAKDGAQIHTEPLPREMKVEISGTAEVVVGIREDTPDAGHVEVPGSLHTILKACRDSAIPTLIPFVLS